MASNHGWWPVADCCGRPRQTDGFVRDHNLVLRIALPYWQLLLGQQAGLHCQQAGMLGQQAGPMRLDKSTRTTAVSRTVTPFFLARSYLYLIAGQWEAWQVGALPADVLPRQHRAHPQPHLQLCQRRDLATKIFSWKSRGWTLDSTS